jgi:diacylglycerol kinase family enzyme
VWQYLRQRREPPELTVELPDEPPIPGVRLAIVSNTDPWTYLGSRPVRINPGSSFDDGLGLFALHSLGLPTVLGVLRRAMRRAGGPSGENVLRRDSVASIRLRSDVPVRLQVDGDHLGERSEVEFVAVPAALRVVV